MRFVLSVLRRARLLLFAATALVANAQQLPPAEPPQPLPHGDIPTLRITTKEVLVPTLVEKRGGGIVYGLKGDDFVVEDNGVPQKVHVQEEMDTAPVSLVVAVEQGGVSVLEFDKVAKLGPLLDLFLSDPRSQAALVGFDSQPHLIRDFGHSSEDLNQALKTMQPGDGGDAILDTISYAVDLLQTQPKEFRRVLLLISEERDHGSKHTKAEQVIKKIGESDVLVLTVSFSPDSGGVCARHQGFGREPDDEHGVDAGGAGAGVPKERDQGNRADERRRIHHVHQRQEVRGAGRGRGQARAEPLPADVPSLESDARGCIR